MRIRDPGWKKNSDTGVGIEKIQIRDKYPGSATNIPDPQQCLIITYSHFYSFIGQGDVNATNTAGGLSLQYGSSLPALRPL
jgi:hypothetical protein